MSISLDNEEQVESVVLLERYDMDGRRIDHGGRTDSDDHP